MQDTETYADLVRRAHNLDIERKSIEHSMIEWRKANNIVTFRAYQTAVLMAANAGLVVGICLVKIWEAFTK